MVDEVVEVVVEVDVTVLRYWDDVLDPGYC